MLHRLPDAQIGDPVGRRRPDHGDDVAPGRIEAVGPRPSQIEQRLRGGGGDRAEPHVADVGGAPQCSPEPLHRLRRGHRRPGVVDEPVQRPVPVTGLDRGPGAERGQQADPRWVDDHRFAPLHQHGEPRGAHGRTACDPHLPPGLDLPVDPVLDHRAELEPVGDRPGEPAGLPGRCDRRPRGTKQELHVHRGGSTTEGVGDHGVSLGAPWGHGQGRRTRHEGPEGEDAHGLPVASRRRADHRRKSSSTAQTSTGIGTRRAITQAGRGAIPNTSRTPGR